MHHATLKTSPRLRRVYALLSDGGPHTTREIIQEAGVCAVNSIIAELRANDINIDCQRVRGQKGVYRYTLC